MTEVDPHSGVRLPSPFDAFYRKEYPRVVALGYGLTGDRWIAEDIAQEAFLRAHREWVRFSQVELPAAWVRRVAINLAHSRHRRLRVERVALARLHTKETTFSLDDPDYEKFWAEVRQLPRRQSHAIALRYIDDLAVQQIAEVLEISDGSVKALLHQGRERLRRQLAVKGIVDLEV